MAHKAGEWADWERERETSVVAGEIQQPRRRVLAAGLSNVECPTLGPGGWILNVCSLDRPEEGWPTRAGDITVTHPDRPLDTSVLFSTSTHLTSGIPAALAFGPDQAIYVADEGRRAIVRVTASGDISNLITHHQGERINGPNDLSFDQNGDLYFTDPWMSSPNNPVAAVYQYDWESQKTLLIDGGMEFTNGIVVRDGLLYVAETFSRAVWVYEVDGGSRLFDKRLFCRLPPVENPPLLSPSVRESIGVDYVVGPDGMAFDIEGNLWIAHYGGSGVFVYDPAGQLLDVLRMPGTTPTNLCFGGPNLDLVYVAVDDLGVILEYAPGVQGDRINFCPSRVKDHAWMAVILDGAMPLPGRRVIDRVESPPLGQYH